MMTLESLAYLVPLCIFIGATTALTKSDDARTVFLIALRYAASLALGIVALGLVLVLLNLWL